MKFRNALAISLAMHLGAVALVVALYQAGLGGEMTQAPQVLIEINSVEAVTTASSPGKIISSREKAPVREKIATISEHVPERVSGPSAASSANSSIAGSLAIHSYLAQIRDKLSREIRPPRAGGFSLLRVILKMTLRNTGEVENSTIEQSSGSPDFDESVINALQRARPFPAFSAEMSGVREVTIKLPIEIRSRR